MKISSAELHSDWITQVSHPAMATEFVIMLAPNHSHAVEKAVSTLERLEEIERRLTVYRPDSEISRVNSDAASKPVRVSPSTFQILETAVNWSRRTAGRFDVTAGPLVKIWGFHDRKGRQPTPEELAQALSAVGYQHLILDPSDLTVRFAVPGMSINLGGIGKGFAIDELARHLRDSGVTDFLIHGGQSSVLAAGNQSPNDDRGWAVGIAHPLRPQSRLAGAWLKDAALGTSGSGNQFFHHRGKRVGHVIDPRTGYPSTDLLSVSVRTTLAIDADAAGTAAFLGGSDGLSQRDTATNQSLDLWDAVLAVRAGKAKANATVVTDGDWDWIDPPESLESLVGKSESNRDITADSLPIGLDSQNDSSLEEHRSSDGAEAV